MSTAISEVESR